LEVHGCAREKQRYECSETWRKLRKHGEAHEELLSKSQRLHQVFPAQETTQEELVETRLERLDLEASHQIAVTPLRNDGEAHRKS